MQQKTYTIQFTEAGLAYIRRALGACPYDEAGPLIVNMEQQRVEQDKPLQTVEIPPEAPAATRPSRAKKAAAQPPASLNGSGAAQPDAAH
jgi:hypothetical protein